MQCLCNNFNFTAGSDHLDFTNIKRMSINLFSLCSQIVSPPPPNPDKNSKLLKWINGVSTICLSSHVQHQTCVHGHFKVRGVSFTVRGLHAVMCEDDGSDSTHYYLMIYCNSFTMGICFVFRSSLPSSPWLSPVMYFCLRFVSAIKELSNTPIGLRDDVNQEALSTVKTLMSGPPEQTGGPSPLFVVHPQN